MWRIERLAETGSTNDDLAPRLGPEAAGVVRVAEVQTAGRGRRAGRRWIAPRGSGLLFTTALPRPVAPSALWCVTFWASLAIREAVRRACGVAPSLAWPNDLLLDGRKCCGILCVSRIQGSRAWVGVGSGVNVRRPDDASLTAAVEPPPAFLSDAAPAIDAERLLESVLAVYDERLRDLDDPDGVARRWERDAQLDGTSYDVLVDGEHAPRRVVARSIAGDGSLVAEENGRVRTIALADARVLR